MVVIEEELGLRERKRRATRHAIQLAAIKLTADRGLDGVTVEEISHAAQVSPRTFFNYFPSKESAIIGELPVLSNRERIQRFVTAGPEESLLIGLGELLVGAIDDGDFFGADADGEDDVSLHELRRDLLKGNPHLFSLRMATMREFEEELATVIQNRLTHDDPALAGDEENLNQRARLVTYVAFAGMRHAWSCWADRDNHSSLARRLRASFEQLNGLGAVTL